MRHFVRLFAAAALALSFSQASAVPLANGVILDGTTFGTDNSFQFTNTSTSGEQIVSILWDLAPINGFFDVTTANPGNSPSGPSVSGTTSAMSWSFPAPSVLDGSSLLQINFAGFDAGETFIFGVDTDLFSSIDAFGIEGTQFIGATATAVFSDGTATQGTYVASSQPGIGVEVDIVNVVPNPVPAPAALFLLGAGLIGMGVLRRRA